MNLKHVFSIALSALFLVGATTLGAAEKEAAKSVPSLDSANPVEQVAACRMLGAKGDKDSVPALVNLLETTSNTDVAAAAAAALGAIGEKKDAVDALLRVGSKSESARVQYASILALANLRDSDNAEGIDNLISNFAETASDDLLKDLASKLQARASK